MKNTDAVKKLQQMLNATLVPSPKLSVDGAMGLKTRSAFARYNAAKRHIGEGDVGRLISANASSASTDVTAGSPASDAWMAVAEAELGTAEVAGTARNQRIIAYHSATSLEAKSDEVPWCSSFVNWVMRQAGYASTNSALAKSWLGWGVACGPRYGAVTVIKKRGASSDAATGSSTGFHVGFLIEATQGRVRLLGGNQGDMVKLSNFYLTATRCADTGGHNEVAFAGRRSGVRSCLGLPGRAAGSRSSLAEQRPGWVRTPGAKL